MGPAARGRGQARPPDARLVIELAPAAQACEQAQLESFRACGADACELRAYAG
jgi:hypothetical protein